MDGYLSPRSGGGEDTLVPGLGVRGYPSPKSGGLVPHGQGSLTPPHTKNFGNVFCIFFSNYGHTGGFSCSCIFFQFKMKYYTFCKSSSKRVRRSETFELYKTNLSGNPSPWQCPSDERKCRLHRITEIYQTARYQLFPCFVFNTSD